MIGVTTPLRIFLDRRMALTVVFSHAWYELSYHVVPLTPLTPFVISLLDTRLGNSLSSSHKYAYPGLVAMTFIAMLQDDMQDIRQHMIYEILEQTLV